MSDEKNDFILVNNPEENKNSETQSMDTPGQTPNLQQNAVPPNGFQYWSQQAAQGTTIPVSPVSPYQQTGNPDINTAQTANDQVSGTVPTQDVYRTGYGQPYYQPPFPYPVYPGYTNGTVPPEPPKKKSSGRFKKTVKYVACAVLFGVVASGVFLGANRVYYHFNPDDKPVSNATANDRSQSEKLKLESPNKDDKLSTTNVTTEKIPGADVSEIVKQAMPSTVSVTGSFTTGTNIWGQQYNQESTGAGSGIIIDKNETELLIVTNNHVVAGAKNIKINFIDGEEAPAVIKGTDESQDLAVLSVKLSDLSEDTLNAIKVAKIGDSDGAKVGQMVIAIGNALGYGQTVTVGYISAKDREVTMSDTNTTMTLMQVDAAINPGNSGGALLNINGEVIGINSAKITGTTVERIGYAIPISSAVSTIDDLKNREILNDEDKGYLGVTPITVSNEAITAYNWPAGIYIKSVVEGSGAAEAGLLPGDIITAIDGTAVKTDAQLRSKVNSYRYNTSIKVTYSRIKNGKYVSQETEVVLMKNPNLTTGNSNNNNTTVPEQPIDNGANGQTPSVPENDSQYNDIEDFFNDFFDSVMP